VTPAEAPPSPRRPVVVVAGRPNVGKSSLVNRVVGRRAAVVEEEAGVTRDRKRWEAEWNGVAFDLVDTGGWLAGGDTLDAKVSEQSERAVDEADLVLLVTDVIVGVTEEDLAAAKVIRRAGAPVLLVVNKVDDAAREPAAWDFVALGVGDPWLVSAIHGRGTGDLLDEVVAASRPRSRARSCRRRPRWWSTAAGVRAGRSGRERHTPGGPGRRPNVGKSTLFNRLSGEDRPWSTTCPARPVMPSTRW